ncbi:hypothetical protein V8D89_015888 [Ganoderma adspersum]
MNTWATLLVLLAYALSSTALTTPYFRARQASNSDSDTLCSSGVEPTLIAASSFVFGNQTIELSKLSCVASDNTTSPLSAAHACSEDDGFWGWLEGILWWFFPHPDCSKPKTTTVTKATTATRTSTVTSVSVSVSVSATTATATEVTTATATETTTATTTATDVTTVVQSTTATDVVTVTTTASAAAPSSTGTNVCGELCTNICSELGQLPPTSDDCQQLVNAITILNGQIDPDFTVDSNHVQTITFGTCRFFFENISPAPLTYCWLSLAQVASAAASQCLPPNQPVLSEGLCIARDSTWEVGVAHS